MVPNTAGWCQSEPAPSNAPRARRSTDTRQPRTISSPASAHGVRFLVSDRAHRTSTPAIFHDAAIWPSTSQPGGVAGLSERVWGLWLGGCWAMAEGASGFAGVFCDGRGERKCNHFPRGGVQKVGRGRHPVRQGVFCGLGFAAAPGSDGGRFFRRSWSGLRVWGTGTEEAASRRRVASVLVLETIRELPRSGRPVQLHSHIR